MDIDIERCERGMKQICVRGQVTPSRHYLLEEAIEKIQNNPDDAMKDEYLGIKNYAAFGDQRSDANYGYGPKHGSIVFEIGRQRSPAPSTLNSDAIYLLECVRDFGTLEVKGRPGPRDTKRLNLTDAIRALRAAEAEARFYANEINEADVESHVSECA